MSRIFCLLLTFLILGISAFSQDMDSLRSQPVASLLQQGVQQYKDRDYATARTLMRAVVRHPEASAEDQARAYRVWGLAEEKLDNFQAAIPPFSQAWQLFGQFPDSINQLRKAAVGKVLGVNYMKVGDYDRAMFVLEAAAESYVVNNGLPDRISFTYQELARANSKVGKIPSAIQWLRRAEAVVGQTEKAWASLANLILDIDTTEHSLQQKQTYQALAQKLLLEKYQPSKRDMAGVFLSQGRFYHQQHAYDSALWAYQYALYQLFPEAVDTSDASRILPDSLYDCENHILRCLRGKAECFEALGEQLTALNHYQAMIQAEAAIAACQTYKSSQYLLLEDQRPSLGAALDLATQASVPAELAYEFFEKSKSQVLNAGVRQAQLEKELLPEELRKEKQTIEMLLAEAEQKLGTTKGNETRWQSSRDSLRFLRATLLDSIRQYQKNSGELSMTLPFVPLADLQTRLAPDQVMIQYVWERGLYALAISKTRTQTYRLPAIAEEMALLPQLLHSSPPQETAESIQQYGTSAHSLYQKLLAPILADFPAAKRLLIIPDGGLHQLPFDALLTSVPAWDNWPPELAFEQFWKGSLRIPEWGAAYLLLDYEVQYSFSASLWYATQEQARKPSLGFLGYAPQYTEQDSFRGSRLIPLPSALPHSERIAALFGRKGQVIQTAGSTHFHQYAPQAQYLHLAMHSFVDHDFPQRSTLGFGREQEQQSGQIIAANLYAMPLLSARLVSLLACKSGDGKQIQGEGVLSLGRAFRMAGAQAVIMSLWDADARLGGKVLETTYEQLRAGKNISASLRAAKIDYLDQATAFEAHPSHWANYVLFGEDHPQNQSSNSWWIGLLMGGGMVLGWGVWKKWRTSS